MNSKYLFPAFIITTVLFWLLALVIPGQAGLFLLLRNISFLFSLLYGGILVGMLVMAFTQYQNIDYPPLQKEHFEITAKDGVILRGEIFTGHTDDSSPVIIASHGWAMSLKQLYPMTYPLVVQGYKVVLYNHRGHGQKPFNSEGNKKDIDKTHMDVQQVVDFIEDRSDLNHNKLAAMGFSLGGGTLLTGGYTDPRIKLIMAFCTGTDWLEMVQTWAWYVRFYFRLTGLPINISKEFNRKISARYYLSKKAEKTVCLGHAKNDRVVPFEGFLKNKELLDLPDEQTLILTSGDHGFFGQNTVVLSQILKWLHDYLH